MFISFVFIYFSLRKNIKYIVISLVMTFFLINLFVSIYPEIFEFLQYKINEGGASHRDIIWQDSFNRWSDVPIFGLGPNQHTYFWGDKILSTHNYYIAVLVNTGVFTLFSFLFFIKAKCIYIIMRNEQKDVGIFIYSFSAISSLAIHQLFEAGGFSISSITGFGVMVLIAVVCNKDTLRKV